MDELAEIFDDLLEGGAAAPPLRVEVVRALDASDLALGPALAPLSLKSLHYSHHSLAKLLAEGKSDMEASLATAYPPSYVQRIRQNESFRELVEHYRHVEVELVSDTLGIMRGVGLDALAILRERQERDPDALSVGQLQEQVKLLLIEPMKSEAISRGYGTSAASPIRISFINAERNAKTIEGTMGDADEASAEAEAS